LIRQQWQRPRAAVVIDADGDDDLIGSTIIRNASNHGPSYGLRQQWGTGSPGASGIVPLLGADGTALLAGDGKLSLPLGPLSPSLAGIEVYLQAAFLDTAVGVSLSNAVTLRLAQ